MKAVIFGANGAMGRILSEKLREETVGRVSPSGGQGAARSLEELGAVEADVIIDFSHHSAVEEVLDWAKARGCAAVIGTTGHTPEEKEKIRAAAREIPVFYSGNMSLGVAVLCSLTRQAVAAFPDGDVEIVEIHHNRKVDAPSGTAWMLFDAVKEARPQAVANCGRSGECKRTKEEVGISSLRMGTVTGIHEVHIHAGTQCLTLRHQAYTREMFADGAVDVARYMVGKAPGYYDMKAFLKG